MRSIGETELRGWNWLHLEHWERRRGIPPDQPLLILHFPWVLSTGRLQRSPSREKREGTRWLVGARGWMGFISPNVSSTLNLNQLVGVGEEGGRCGQTEAGISAGGVSPGISLPQRECRVSARSGGGGLPFLEGPLTKTRWARRNRQRNQSNFLLGQNTRQDCPHLGWRRYKHAAGIRRGVVEGGWGEGEATAEVEKPSLKCAQGAESRAAATSPGAQWARGPPPARARRPAGLWLPSSPRQRPGGGRAELRRGRPRGKWGAGRGAGAAARDCGSERRTPPPPECSDCAGEEAGEEEEPGGEAEPPCGRKCRRRRVFLPWGETDCTS